LHLDAADGQIPISCVLTSASLNDTQVAVPLALLTAQRVTSLYDLMDSGHDSDQIREHSVVELTSEFLFQPVMAHLMFGVLALTADQILRWISPGVTDPAVIAT
jgi:hypothetical protein